MIQILLHSSKTMRIPQSYEAPLGRPQLLAVASEIVAKIQRMTRDELAHMMALSPTKATEVEQMYARWTPGDVGVPVIDIFVGDIYSGLQVQTWSAQDRAYAQQHLLVLSGLYGGLRACDGILPYRLEMGYSLPDGGPLHKYWGNRIASIVPEGISAIINLSAVEYTKSLLPHLSHSVVAPRFLTVSAKTGVPTFVTVHTKIARGAFARWLIRERIDTLSDLPSFDDLGYAYDAAQSTPEQPVFVCQEFGGIGLSVRKT